MFYLYWDPSDEKDPSTMKIVRAPYATQKEAKAQADHYLELGYRVVCIEKSRGPLGGTADALERGEEVWKP